MQVMKNKKCIVLLSGGLDSTTTLYFALKKGYKPVCLIFDYGQRHKKEILSAKKIANMLGIKYFLVKISLPWKGSSLIDTKLKIPKYKQRKHIPSTYVPARNMIFLSYAVSLAEVYKIKYIFYGANQVDFSGYPDCRIRFVKSFENMANTGTKMGTTGRKIRIFAPLINMSKDEIVRLAVKLGVPLQYTWSCYKGGSKPCGICDACKLRKKGFENAKVKDPLYEC